MTVHLYCFLRVMVMNIFLLASRKIGAARQDAGCKRANQIWPFTQGSSFHDLFNLVFHCCWYIAQRKNNRVSSAGIFGIPSKIPHGLPNGILSFFLLFSVKKQNYWDEIIFDQINMWKASHLQIFCLFPGIQFLFLVWALSSHPHPPPPSGKSQF